MLNSSTLNSAPINHTAGSSPGTAGTAVARLYPLRQSAEGRTVESELKALFIHLYEQRLLEKADDLNVYGAAHLGSFALVERFVKADCLALLRNNDDGAMRYLYRAWRARNHGRGLHFLRTYLQLLWPDAWELDQLWQDKDQAYPTALIPAPAPNVAPPNHYLTSRLRVGIEGVTDTPDQIVRMTPALRSVIAAKFVLNVVITRKVESTTRLAGALSGTHVMMAEFDCAPGMPDSEADLAGVTAGTQVMVTEFDMAP
jgi:hypothetical protein